MLDNMDTITFSGDGPKLVAEYTANWEDFLCFDYPESCDSCCFGWRSRCPVDIDVKRKSSERRPDECPLGLVVVIPKY